MPSAEGEGTRVVLLGGEPGSGKSRLVREFAAEAAEDGTLVLYGACDAEVRTPYGAVRRGARAGRPRRSSPRPARRAGAGAAELTRLLPELGSRVGDLRRRPRPTRTPSATGCTRPWPTCSPASPAAAGAARARGRPLGGRPHAPAAASPRARRRGPRPAARHLPGHRGRDAAPCCPRRWRTSAATTSSGWAVRALRRGGGRVRPARRRSDGPSCRARDGDPRAHRRQRVPRLRALAGADRERGGRGRRRRHPREALAGRARQPGERPRGGQPAAGPARARHLGPAGAGVDRGAGVRARDGQARRRARRGRAARGPGRGRAQRHGRGGPGPRAGVPLHPRARAARALRPALAAAPRGASPARGRGARGAARGAPAARSPTSRITSPPRRPSAAAERAVEYNVLRRAGRRGGARVRRGGGRLRTALALGVEEPRGAGGAAARARRGEQPRRPGAGRAGGVPDGGGASRATSATPSCSRARRSATRTPAGARASTTRARSSCWRRRSRRSARRTAGCASGCSAGWRARSTSRDAARRAWSADERDRDGAAAGRPRRRSPPS